MFLSHPGKEFAKCLFTYAFLARSEPVNERSNIEISGATYKFSVRCLFAIEDQRNSV